MSANHRPEVGRTIGVEEWAAGRPYCTIYCDRGHKRRLIDRLLFDDRMRPDGVVIGGSFYNTQWGERVFDESSAAMRGDASATGESGPQGTKWRLSCPCGLDVVLSSESRNQIAKAMRDQGVSKLTLSALAAIVG